MFQLPLWVLPFSKMAFNDAESSTAIEMTAKLYNSMKEFVSEYNRFAENTNQLIADFQSGTDKDIELFKVGIRQEFQDFIDVIQLKYQKQDLDLAEAINFMKQNLSQYVLKHIDEMRSDGELADVVTEAFADKLQEVTVKYEEALAELDETIQNLNDLHEANKKLIEDSLDVLQKNDEENTQEIQDLAKYLEDKKEQYEQYFKNLNFVLETRLENLLESIPNAPTTMDAEIIDARLGEDGVKYSSLGKAIRTQFEKMRVEFGSNVELIKLISENSNLIDRIAPPLSLSDSVVGYTNYNMFDAQIKKLENKANTSYSYKEIDVVEGERYYISGYQSDTQIIIYTDNDLNVVDAIFSTSLRLQEYDVRVPEGATKLFFCFDNTMDAEVRRLPLTDFELFKSMENEIVSLKDRTSSLEDRTSSLEDRMSGLGNSNPEDGGASSLEVAELKNDMNTLKSKTIDVQPLATRINGYYNCSTFGQSSGLVFENSSVFTTYEMDVHAGERYYLRGVGEYTLDNPVFYIVFDKDDNVVQWEQYGDVNLSMGSVVTIQNNGVRLAFGTKSDEDYVMEKLPMMTFEKALVKSALLNNEIEWTEEEKMFICSLFNALNISKVGSGLRIASDGNLNLNGATEAQIDIQASNAFAITPNTLSFAVKVALSKGKTSWSEEEKLNARSLLGLTDIIADLQSQINELKGGTE